MNVMIVGLPLFAKRLAKGLTSFDPTSSYRSYDTYYSRIDQLKFLKDFGKADLVYSLNGSAMKSGVFRRAMKREIPLVMHWMGSDVLQLEQATRNGSQDQDQLDYAVHATEVDWLQNELKTLNVSAHLVQYVTLKKEGKPKEWGNDFQMLTYFAQGKEEFYGLQQVKEIARALPDVAINIVGSDLKGIELPPNIIKHGWVNGLDHLMNKCTVVLRLTEHDGFANMVIEALNKGRYALFTYGPTGVRKHSGLDDNIQWIRSLQERHRQGTLEFNVEGMNYVRTLFDRDRVMSRMKAFMERTIDEHKAH